MRGKICLAFLLLVSCQHKSETEVALLSDTALIASEEMDKLFIAQIDTPLSKEDLHRLDRQYPSTLDKVAKRQHLQATDIIHMTRSGVTDSVIMEVIAESKSQFFLTLEDERELTQAGVSKKVIAFMHATVDTNY